MTHAGGYEPMARDLVDRMQHCQVLYTLLLQQLDEMAPRAPEFVLYSWCHQVPAESTIAMLVRSR